MGELFRLERALQPLEFTGERFTGSVSGQIETDHSHRYFIARDLCRGKDVLDIASGEGYGSALLAQVARRVVGVELDARSTAHAKGAYSRQNLSFVQGDARHFPLRDASFDTVVSFETFEHFSEHDDFLREVKRVLKPGGLLLISTPDRDVYSPAGKTANPYHARELTQDEFRSTLGGAFSAVSVYVQRIFAGSVVAPSSQHISAGAVRSFEKRDSNFAEADHALPRAPILIAVASDQPFQDPFTASLYITNSELENDSNACSEEQSTVSVQLYLFQGTGYCEDDSIRRRIPRHEWCTILFELPRGAGNGPIRIDPADFPAVIEIRKISITDTESGHVLWAAEAPELIRDLTVTGSSVLLPKDDTYVFLSYGTDPQLKLPTFQGFTKPLYVEIQLRVDTTAGVVSDAIELCVHAIQERLERSRNELMSSHTERMLVAAELKRVATDRNDVRRELMRATDEIRTAQAEKLQHDGKRQYLESEVDTLQSRLRSSHDKEQTARNALEELRTKAASLERDLAAERQVRAALERSISWRITKPGRTLMQSLRTALRH